MRIWLAIVIAANLTTITFSVLIIRRVRRTRRRYVEENAPRGGHDVDPVYGRQHDELDAIWAGYKDGSISGEEMARRALAMGPVRGSFGDLNSYGRGGCRHLGPYPGCPGGCNRPDMERKTDLLVPFGRGGP